MALKLSTESAKTLKRAAATVCASYASAALLVVGAASTFLDPYSAHAQSCGGSATLSTQAEVDAFPQDCDVVFGNLVIGGDSPTQPSDISDLSPLAGLRQVNSTLEIKHNPQLASVEPIGGIEWASFINIINNDLLEDLPVFTDLQLPITSIEIEDNDALNDISGFNGLYSMRRSLVIESNSLLEDITGFSGLTDIGGRLVVSQNQSLAKIDGFADLLTVGELITSKQEGIIISGNASLQEITGFSSLSSIAGLLEISNNDALLRMHGFESLSRIVNGHDDDGLLIEGNNQLNDIAGVSAITSIAGSLSILDNPSLTELDEFSGLLQIAEGFGSNVGGPTSEIRIAGNQALTDIEGLAAVSGPLGNVTIVNNDALQSLRGLGGVESIHALGVEGNDSLTSLEGLRQNVEVTGSVSIVDNDSLKNLRGMDSISEPEIIVISDNQSLADINYFDNLASVTSFVIANNESLERADLHLSSLTNQAASLQFQIQSNQSLATIRFNELGVLPSLALIDNPFLSSIEGLERISPTSPGRAGARLVLENSALSSLDFMSSYKSLNGLAVYENTALETLRGVQDVEFVIGAFAVTDNPKLKDCSAVDHLLDAVDDGDVGPGPAPTPDVSSFWGLSGNSEGCNAIAEIAPDTDDDGAGDPFDDFPADPEEWSDTDGDGVGDNADVFPLDSNETTDSDGDGVGDNSDAFPNDPDEVADRDGDGVGDNADAFPDDPASSDLEAIGLPVWLIYEATR